MGGFLYFVDGEPRNTADIINEHGLGYALDPTCALSPVTLGATPSGKPGCLLADSKRHTTPISYSAEHQQWQRLRDHWVGFWKDDIPKPGDLERATVIPGYDVELGDGNEWQVPLARQYAMDGTQGSQLPHRLKLDEEGQWTIGSVVELYSSVWELAEMFFDLWHAALTDAIDEGKESFVFNYDDPHDSAVTMLAANYAISAIEASLLGLLLSNDTAGNIMRSACDCDLAMVWILEAKKNEQESAGLPTDDGNSEASQNTAQLVPT